MTRYRAAMALSDEKKEKALSRLPLFGGVSNASLARLAAVAGGQEFAPGQFIVRQGQVGTGLYVIVEGSVNVVRGADDLLATLNVGDFFGELSVIDQHPRNASVQAVEPTTVLAIASWDFIALIESDPALALNLIKGLAARVRAAGDQHRH